MGPKASGLTTNDQKTAQLSGQVDRLDEQADEANGIHSWQGTPHVFGLLLTPNQIHDRFHLDSVLASTTPQGINIFRRWLDGSVSGCHWARLARLARLAQEEKEWGA